MCQRFPSAVGHLNYGAGTATLLHSYCVFLRARAAYFVHAQGACRRMYIGGGGTATNEDAAALLWRCMKLTPLRASWLFTFFLDVAPRVALKSQPR